MAWKRYARANVTKRDVPLGEWMDVVRKPGEGLVKNAHFEKIAKNTLAKCDPKQYLLSHSTIVASVDTYAPKNVKLGRKLLHGTQIDVKFPDYRIKPETAIYVNNNCCPPGTMILMADGIEKPIEDIIVGDEVISHTGHVRKVTQTFVHCHQGWIYEINRRGDYRSLALTGEHPVWASRPQRYHARTIDPGSFSWISAGLLQKNDYIFTPKLIGESNPSNITPGKAKLLGYYIAEGHLHRLKRQHVSDRICNQFPDEHHNVPVSVSFSLHKNETNTLAADIAYLMLQEFGVKTRIRKHSSSKNSIQLLTKSSIEAVKFFQKYGGEYAKSKKLHSEILTWPLELQKQIVQGWLEGNGTVKQTAGGWLSVSTPSKNLHSGMQILLNRLGCVFSTHKICRSGRKRIRIGNGGFKIIKDGSKICISYLITINALEAEKVITGSFMETAWRHARIGKKNHFLEFRTRDNGIANLIKSVNKKYYSGLVYNLETEIDHSYIANQISVHNSDAFSRPCLLTSYRTFIGVPNYLEHCQLPELSKGFVVDAVARDLGETVYIDILVATDRKHQILINDILSGKLDSLSMGCIAAFTICTKCGNVASDDASVCSCIQYEGKGTRFVDEEGVDHQIAETCGHVSVPNSLQFIEASWVHSPAFRGAVRRNFLNQNFSQTAAKLEKAHVINLGKESDIPDDGVKKAASRIAQAEEPEKPEESKEPEKPAKAEEPSPFEEPEEGAFEAEAGEAEKVKPGKKVDPVEKLVEEVENTLIERIVDRIRLKLIPTEQDVGYVGSPTVDLAEGNENLVRAFELNLKKKFPKSPKLIKWALRTYKIVHLGGRKAIKDSKLSGQDLLILSWIEDKIKNKPYTADLYKAVLAAGHPGAYPSDTSYISVCRLKLGRAISKREEEFFRWKRKIYHLGSI